MVVTGCYAQLKPDAVAKIEGVDVVLGAEQKKDLGDSKGSRFFASLNDKRNSNFFVTTRDFLRYIV